MQAIISKTSTTMKEIEIYIQKFEQKMLQISKILF